VEIANFFYQSALVERDHLLKFTLPYQEKTLRENQVRQELNLEKARQTLAPQAAQKQAALAKLRHERDKHGERLGKLQKDLAAMTLRSPLEGVVYHGKFHKGEWTGSDPHENKLVPHGTVAADEVFMTVVKVRPVFVHVTIDEKDVHLLKPGSEGRAKVPFHPERRLPARLTRLAPLPAAPREFDARLLLELSPQEAKRLPPLPSSP